MYFIVIIKNEHGDNGVRMYRIKSIVVCALYIPPAFTSEGYHSTL